MTASMPSRSTSVIVYVVTLRAAQALALVRDRASGCRSAPCGSSSTDGSRPAAAGEALAAPAERAAQAHAVDVARRRRLRRVAVGVRVEPDRRDRPVHAREAAEDAERERVVAAQHERQLAGAAAAPRRGPRSRSQTSRICVEVLGVRRRPRRAPRSDPRRPCRDRGRRRRARRAARRGPRSGSRRAPCRRRGDPARGRARRRGRRPRGTRAHAATVSSSSGASSAASAGAARRARRRAGRPPAGSGLHDAARLAHEQVARGVIPLGEAVLVEGVEAARGDPRQVERGRAGAPDVARPRQHARDDRRLQLPLRGDVGEPGADERAAASGGAAASRSGAPLSAAALTARGAERLAAQRVVDDRGERVRRRHGRRSRRPTAGCRRGS